MNEINKQAADLLAKHRARAIEMRPLFQRSYRSDVTNEELIRIIEWELWECIYSLEPEAPSNGAFRDGWHASACAFRAVVMLDRFKKKLETGSNQA